MSKFQFDLETVNTNEQSLCGFTWTVTNFNVYFIIWLAPQAGKKTQIACCDWLPEQARWSSGLRAVSRKKNLPQKLYNKSIIDQVCSAKMA